MVSSFMHPLYLLCRRESKYHDIVHVVKTVLEKSGTFNHQSTPFSLFLSSFPFLILVKIKTKSILQASRHSAVIFSCNTDFHTESTDWMNRVMSSSLKFTLGGCPLPRLISNGEYVSSKVSSCSTASLTYCFGKGFIKVLTPSWCITQCVRTQRSHAAELLLNYIRWHQIPVATSKFFAFTVKQSSKSSDKNTAQYVEKCFTRTANLVSGPGYIMHYNVAKNIINAYPHIPIVPLEDAFIGLAAAYSGKVRIMDII